MVLVMAATKVLVMAATKVVLMTVLMAATKVLVMAATKVVLMTVLMAATKVVLMTVLMTMLMAAVLMTMLMAVTKVVLMTVLMTVLMVALMLRKFDFLVLRRIFSNLLYFEAYLNIKKDKKFLDCFLTFRCQRKLSPFYKIQCQKKTFSLFIKFTYYNFIHCIIIFIYKFKSA
jgi:hypothetical protein